MNRFALLFLVALLLALLGLGAAAATWPTADLTYYKAAQVQITDLQTVVDDGLAALSENDAETLAASVEGAKAVADFFADEQASAKLAPVASAGAYAGATCAWVLGYFTKLDAESVNSPFVAPMTVAMRTDCMDAIQSARLELARAVAAVGVWPPTK